MTTGDRSARRPSICRPASSRWSCWTTALQDPRGSSGARPSAAPARAGSLGELRPGAGLEVAAALDAGPRGQLPPPAPAVRGQVGADRVRGEEDRHRDNYYVAAKLDLGLIAKDWIPEEMDEVTGRSPAGRHPRRGGASDLRRAAAADAVPVRGVVRQDAVRVAHPDHAARRRRAARAGRDAKRLLGVLLVPVSLVIIAVGLGVLWLSVRAERRASQLKSDFIANVSHELKTPLSLIRMFGEMLATGQTQERGEAREYADIITRETERLSRLIDNVLDFARIERGKASYDFAEGDLDEVVERALDVFRHRLEKEKLRLAHRDRGRPARVRIDEDAMTLVLLNLVDNAVKYGGDGGEVSVRLRRVPGRGGAVDRRSRPGHRARRAAPDLRALLPRRDGARPQRPRLRHRAGAGQAHRRGARRPRRGRQRAGAGSTFTVFVPAAPIVDAGARGAGRLVSGPLSLLHSGRRAPPRV